LEERIDACRKHLLGSVAWKGEKLGLLEMRRHYANYLRGLPHIKEFRTRLVSVLTLAEVEDILEEMQASYAMHA
jgi:tRNA-dihydrouridine synthase